MSIYVIKTFLLMFSLSTSCYQVAISDCRTTAAGIVLPAAVPSRHSFVQLLDFFRRQTPAIDVGCNELADRCAGDAPWDAAIGSKECAKPLGDTSLVLIDTLGIPRQNDLFPSDGLMKLCLSCFKMIPVLVNFFLEDVLRDQTDQHGNMVTVGANKRAAEPTPCSPCLMQEIRA